MNSQYGIANAIRLIYQMGGNALQVCVSNLQETKVGKPLEQQDVTDTLALREKFGIYLVVHGKYVYNFCRITWAWQLKCLAFELEQAGRVNADLVIHQGKNLPELFLTREEAIRNYVRQIESVLMDYPGQNRILLENSCKQGNELGSTVQELAEIYHLFLPEVRHRIGFCIDTCHIYVSGELDMQPKSVLQFFNAFESLIGLDKLCLIHLNDSAVKFGGCNDHHANLFQGFMPQNGLETFIRRCHHIPMILETPSIQIRTEIQSIKNLF